MEFRMYHKRLKRHFPVSLIPILEILVLIFICSHSPLLQTKTLIVLNWGIDPVSLNGELLYESHTDFDSASYSVVKRPSLYPINNYTDTKKDDDVIIKFWSGSFVPDEAVTKL